MEHFEIYKKDPATGALYPEGQRRKKGLARILEIVVRDFWQLLGSGLIATAAALPRTKRVRSRAERTSTLPT